MVHQYLGRRQPNEPAADDQSLHRDGTGIARSVEGSDRQRNIADADVIGRVNEPRFCTVAASFDQALECRCIRAQ
jgi:hypothetical protein